MTRRGRSSAPPSPASPPTRSSTAPRHCRRSSAASSATPNYSNLPRKFKTSLTGHPSHDTCPETNDVSFVGTVHPEHGPGFDLWVGGGLSTNPMLAQKLGVWIPLDEVADAWEGVVSIFRDYGYRRLRSRARLKFLVADWGVDRFREVLETEYLQRRLVNNPSPEVPAVQGDHIGVHEQKDGRFYVGVAPTAGRVSGTILTRLADAIEEYGASGARLTPYQKIVVLGVEKDRLPGLLDRLDEIGLSARPSYWRRNTMACTGIEFCKLAIVDTKQRAADLVDTLEARFPDLDTPITVNVNGCPNACARTQVADIGLKGQLVLDERRQPGRGLPGAPRRRPRARPDVRQEAPRPQGDQCRARRLRHQRGRPPSSPTARTASASPAGSPAPTTTCCAARQALGDCPMSERAVPFHCPYCGDEDLWPHEPAEGSGHGAWECRSCLRAFSVKMLGQLRPPASATPAPAPTSEEVTR